KRIFFSRMITRGFSPGKPENPVAAFCGVGNPKAFFQQLRAAGFALAATRVFPDHHYYNGQDVRALVEEAKRSGAHSLVTTAKDAVKLSEFEFEIPCHVLEIEISISDEMAFAEMILRSLGLTQVK